MEKYTLETYERYDSVVFTKWENLWNKSDNSNIWNSPYWFAAYLETFKPRNYIIILVTANNEDKIICPLVETKKYGIKIFESPYSEILDKTSILFSGKDIRMLEFLFTEITKLGSVLVSEIDGELLSEVISKKYAVKLSSSVNYFLPLQSDPLRFIKRKKLKKLTKLINRIQDKISYTHSSGTDFSKLKLLFEISKYSYKRKVKGYKNPFADEKTKNFIEGFIKKNPNKVSVDILFFEDKPIAFYMGYVHKNTYFAFQTAYLSEYKYIKPGIMLNLLLIKRLHREGYKMFDFGRGGGRHKSEITPLHKIQDNIIISKNPVVRLWFQFVSRVLNSIQNCESFYKLYCYFRKIVSCEKYCFSLS